MKLKKKKTTPKKHKNPKMLLENTVYRIKSYDLNWNLRYQSVSMCVKSMTYPEMNGYYMDDIYMEYSEDNMPEQHDWFLTLQDKYLVIEEIEDIQIYVEEYPEYFI